MEGVCSPAAFNAILLVSFLINMAALFFVTCNLDTFCPRLDNWLEQRQKRALKKERSLSCFEA